MPSFRISTWAILFLLCASPVTWAAKPMDGKSSDTHTADDSTVEGLVETCRSAVVVITVTGRDGKQQGMGTGFVISKDGLVATNLHVIGEARPITVQFANGKSYKATAVHASDRPLDLAIVRIEGKNLPHLKLGDSAKLKQGQRVVALGNPLGLKHSVVRGVVSGIREMDGRTMLQLAMPIEPGNSGGPLLDMQGNVHGVLTLKSAVTANLGFAVAINHLKPLIEKPNPVAMSRWLTIGALDPAEWQPLFGAHWQQRAGRILVTGQGKGFGGRSLCLFQGKVPDLPHELAVKVKLSDESGAAGLVFVSDGGQRHYGFYPSNGRLRLSRFDGPTVFQWTVLHDVPSKHYRPDDWNQLKVRLEKDRIQCFVNDHLVIESADKKLSLGQIGLAKFRHTRAEFKGFRVGKSIESSAPSQKAIARIDKLLKNSSTLNDFLPADLKPLRQDSDVSLTVLAERAKKLERRAANLHRLATQVHVQSIAAEMRKLLKADDAEIDLLRAALLVARLDDRELDVAAYVTEVDRIVRDVKRQIQKNAGRQARLAALNKYLFKDNGFHGSRTDYYHQANSYLNRVIDDREGLPITLSVLYMELGRRLGLSLEGVGLPGHFVVRFIPQEGNGQLIDVFDGGTLMSREQAAQRVRDFTGLELNDEHLKTYTKKAIVVRMLTNLYGIAERAQRKEAMLGYVELIVAVDPKLLPQRGLRAILRFQNGQHRAALSDLDWFLQKKPKGIDLERIRQMRKQFEERIKLVSGEE